MLADSEEQRSKETNACEVFTRCKSSKAKGKYASFDYTDIDVQCKIGFEEYEKR